MKLIIKSADYALTKSVMYGTIQGVSDGMITTTGLMTNFPWSKEAAEYMKKYPHVCLGEDINITVGKPAADPKLIPSLLQENGYFKNSKLYRSAKEEVIEYEEALIETEAQLKRFIEYFGKLPEYMQTHANKGSGKVVISKAIAEISKKYGIPDYTKTRDELIYCPEVYTIPFPLEVQTKRCLEDDIINDRLGILNCGKEFVMLNLHCGYLDRNLEAVSSFTYCRVDDLGAACSDKVRKWLADNNIELISYRDVPIL